MVKLRLSRFGTHKRPFYRLVATDSRNPRDGRFIEQLGYYDPLPEPKVVKFDIERVDYWLSVGAQASETVQRLLKKARENAAATGNA